jgi:hypothetical protein
MRASTVDSVKTLAGPIMHGENQHLQVRSSAAAYVQQVTLMSAAQPSTSVSSDVGHRAPPLGGWVFPVAAHTSTGRRQQQACGCTATLACGLWVHAECAVLSVGIGMRCRP